MVSYNAACDAGFYYSETLADLRRDLLIRLGYAAQVDNPPPGMTALLDNFLRRGQAFLYRRYRPLQTERFYSWTMVVDERFYGILANEDDCGKKVNFDRITGVWVEDLNGTWLPLTRGIDASWFTSIDRPGLPSHYAIRQNIEVFPAPAEEYTLHVKGHFGLLPFTEDDDICTIDHELLFLWALANAKNHYGQPDGRDIAEEAQTMLRDIIADSHGDARYVPGTRQMPAATRPLFVDLEE
jgi:hypothetical protein